MSVHSAVAAASARLHLETAISLVGREQVLEWLGTVTSSAPAPVAMPTMTTTIRRVVASTTAATGQRGRKAGVLPTADQRCSWSMTNGEQCCNKKKDGNSFCGLHIGKIHLIDTTGASSVSGGDE
jgi:hypothetical protein